MCFLTNKIRILLFQIGMVVYLSHIITLFTYFRSSVVIPSPCKAYSTVMNYSGFYLFSILNDERSLQRYQSLSCQKLNRMIRFDLYGIARFFRSIVLILELLRRSDHMFLHRKNPSRLYLRCYMLCFPLRLVQS